MKRGSKLPADKVKAIQGAVAALDKTFGTGTVIRMGDAPSMRDKIKVIPSGCLALDEALGVGGYPRGRIVEIYGPESGGKTTMTLHAIAECQKAGGIAAFIDAEHALDPQWAWDIGVDVDELLLSQPESGEEALEIASKLVDTGAVDLIVVDSVAALVPKAELEGDIGDAHVALQARLMSQALRKLKANVARSQCILMFINQVRMKIGVMFGNPETTSGGRALKFYASVRVSVAFTGKITVGPKESKEVIGGKRIAKVVKNKVASPFKEAKFDIMFGGEHGYGVDRAREMLTKAIDADVVEKSGSWFSYNGDHIGQGFVKARQHLVDNPKTLEEIAGKLAPTT